MGQHNLNRVMKPQQIAVVGASEQTGTIGNALMKNLLEGGFTGTVLPVNRKYETIHNLPSFRAVTELEDGVDLAIIAAPMETVPGVVQECVDKKMGGAIIISAGGKEVGAQGKMVEAKILDIARPAGFRLIGPNCLGVIQPSLNLNATFVAGMPAAGNLAFVSQSGGICSSILDMALKQHIGFSHFVSIGSMIDVDFGDMIDYFGNDHSVKSILLYIENLTNFRKFMSAARSVARVKPIIVLKAGRSTAGAKAAASHTGAMVGEDAVYDVAFKRAGIVRVDTIEELFDCAEIMAKQPRPLGSRLAIITNGGGPGVMAADFLSQHGHEPAQLHMETVAKLNVILPSYWSRNNPIDILGDASIVRFRQVLDVCLHARELDGILVILAPQAMVDLTTFAKALVNAMMGHQYPIFTCLMGGKSIGEAVEFLNGSGLPTFETPERAIRAFLHMVAYAENQEMLLEVPPKLTRNMIFDRKKVDEILTWNPNEGFLADADVWGILTAYGLPVIRMEKADTEEQALRLSRNIGYPVAMKLYSSDIIHKSDAGGVCLDLRSDMDIRRAYQQIMTSVSRYRQGTRIEGVTVQPYLANPDFEVLLGAKRDADFGPVILFGMGGIFTEILKDRALGLPPMNRLLARRMMRQTKIHTLLQGYRNRPPADFEKLEEMIMRLSQLLVDFPQISELDMNPVLIKNGVPVVVDARLMVSPINVPSSLHLVISPYPAENEYRIVTESGIPLYIRPIKPEDAPIYLNLFKELSPTSIYYRFFGALKEMQPDMLARFTQIDYDREIALVAIDEEAETERMLGVARIIGDPDGTKGEFAVLVGDAWQGKGIGAGLLRKCLLIAEKRGFKNIHGIVLKENRNMIALGKKLGFMVNRGEDSGEFELQVNFGPSEILEGLSDSR
jgi:acetyltransferase